jgi:hypothetical protein
MTQSLLLPTAHRDTFTETACHHKTSGRYFALDRLEVQYTLRNSIASAHC